jgi:hypothetical protein
VRTASHALLETSLLPLWIEPWASESCTVQKELGPGIVAAAPDMAVARQESDGAWEGWVLGQMGTVAEETENKYGANAFLFMSLAAQINTLREVCICVCVCA